MTCKKMILCADDEQSLSIHKLTLATRGYRVLPANSLAEALNLFALGGIDLVMSATELPDGSGTALALAVKSSSPEVPVVLLGNKLRNYHTDAPVELLLRKGAFTPAELLEHIRLLLVKRRGPRRQTASLHGSAQAAS